MTVSNEDISRLSKSIVAEIPADRVGALLNKFPGAAAAGNCGAGCGEGCCGAACSTTDGLNIDRYGHAGFDAATLNAIGKNHLADLRQSVKSQLMAKAANL